MPNVTFHTLWHTLSTRDIEHGMSILILRKIFVHSNLTTTLNKYDHTKYDYKKFFFCILE